MSDFADFVLGCWPAVVEVIAVLAIALALIQAARLTLHLAAAGRERRRRQAAVLRLRRSAAMQRTRPMDLGGLVIDPEMYWCAPRGDQAADAPTEVIDPDPALGCPCCTARDYITGDCNCAVPCSWKGCQAIDPALGCTWCRPGTLHAWPCQCAADCGDPACVAGVRHG